MKILKRGGNHLLQTMEMVVLTSLSVYQVASVPFEFENIISKTY